MIENSYQYCSAECSDGSDANSKLPNYGLGTFLCCSKDNCNTIDNPRTTPFMQLVKLQTAKNRTSNKETGFKKYVFYLVKLKLS